MILDPTDDGPHAVGPESNWNESMYFQFHDPVARLGGFLRLAKRPNEGRGERTICLYLPDGTVAFGFDRPPTESDDQFRGGGLAVEMVEPFERMRVTFEGPVNLLPDPDALNDPKVALAGTTVSPCTVALEIRAAASPYAQTFDGGDDSFAPNHYEQLVTVAGSVSLGDAVLTVEGHGLRDHSWGPRSWQAPYFYRWVHGSAQGRGFMGAYFGGADGSDRSGGFVWHDGELHSCDRAEVTTERDAGAKLRVVRVTLSAAERQWTFRGDVGTVVPLRHRRRDDASGRDATRIAEAATVWTASDGATLHGMSEYLDQVRDGQPVGLRV